MGKLLGEEAAHALHEGARHALQPVQETAVISEGSLLESWTNVWGLVVREPLKPCVEVRVMRCSLHNGHSFVRKQLHAQLFRAAMLRSAWRSRANAMWHYSMTSEGEEARPFFLLLHSRHAGQVGRQCQTRLLLRCRRCHHRLRRRLQHKTVSSAKTVKWEGAPSSLLSATPPPPAPPAAAVAEIGTSAR